MGQKFEARLRMVQNNGSEQPFFGVGLSGHYWNCNIELLQELNEIVKKQ